MKGVKDKIVAVHVLHFSWILGGSSFNAKEDSQRSPVKSFENTVLLNGEVFLLRYFLKKIGRELS